MGILRIIALFMAFCLVSGVLAGCGENEDVVILTSDEIKQAIDSIAGISSVKIITEENDPNGNLGKAGSYIGGVYFVSDWINESDYDYVYDDDWNKTDILEITTDNGGCIEVYANKSDAKKRDDYLAGFDGTLFASGSHTVFNTMVIRISNNLKASQQKELEQAIIKALS